MDNNIKKSKRALTLNSYTREEINNIISQTQDHAKLMIFYIDHIKNYKELTEEILENIKKFDDNSKMILIIEYNSVIKELTLYSKMSGK